jgi:hypothetical protein
MHGSSEPSITGLARPEGQSKRILGPSGNVLVEHVVDASEYAAPEIDRGQLQAMLAESLTPGMIQWGRKLKSVTPDDTGPAAHGRPFSHAETLSCSSSGSWCGAGYSVTVPGCTTHGSGR